jgi:hypothetical protein
LPVRVPVTVAARPSADHPPLDDFQRHGAAAAVNGIVGRAVDATGPNGERLTVAGRRLP